VAGCWEFTHGAQHVTEQWMRPEGESLLGMSRTTSEGRTVAYEFLLIRPGPNGVEYVAKPSGQAEAVFTAVRVTEREAIFENPTHDFPTRIAYRLQADGSLLAVVDGRVNGQPRALEFAYRAASCGR
jgi:hypothetical protein